MNSDNTIIFEPPILTRSINQGYWERGLQEMEEDDNHNVIVYLHNELHFDPTIIPYGNTTFTKKWIYELVDNGKYIEKKTFLKDYNDETIIYKQKSEPFIFPHVLVANNIDK